MFPDQDVNRHNYQLRFMEMENKIKRWWALSIFLFYRIFQITNNIFIQSELERAELEQRFAQLMRERQEW